MLEKLAHKIRGTPVKKSFEYAETNGESFIKAVPPADFVLKPYPNDLMRGPQPIHRSSQPRDGTGLHR
jgi:hypothetical protein